MTVFSKSTLSLAAVATATVLAACGGKKEPETQANANSQYPQQGGYGQPQQGGYGQPQQGGYGQQQQQPPPAQTAAPAQTGGAMATPGAPAQQMDPSAGAAATAILTQLATGAIMTGAKPLGSAIVGNFQQGQTLEGQLQLSPGKCYTVVGAGVPPVTEVNLQLVAVTPIPGMVPVLAQDADQGAQAVLGRKPNCYKWPFPMGAPVKVVVTVAGGSGIAAAQVYEK